MNSPGTEPGVVSDLPDLEAIPFTDLRDLEGDPLRTSMRTVVDRTSRVAARYPSSNGGGGERID
ncbi:MAG TPA: hypothetical protein VGP26_27345 [Actinophytocola sp.]|jgi:hypothetical protein|nr:hypothetical protein [Actinophytocola sp.]